LGDDIVDIARGDADIGLGLHVGRAVDVAHHGRIRIGGLQLPELVAAAPAVWGRLQESASLPPEPVPERLLRWGHLRESGTCGWTGAIGRGGAGDVRPWRR
jgi:hypothetical protein